MRTRRLIVATPEGERELLFIGRLTAGRAAECDISLADNKVSRQHAEFDASGPMPRVTDLGSRNGILVNGRKVGSAELAPGDVVTVGDARIRFEERAASAAVPAPITDDRTTVLPVGAPGLHAAPLASNPARAASVALAPEPGAVPDGDRGSSAPPPAPVTPSAAEDRTSVLPRMPVPAPGAASAPAASASDDRTAVLPRMPVPAAQRPSTPAPVADDDRTTVLPGPVASPRPSTPVPPAATPPAAAPAAAAAITSVPDAAPPLASAGSAGADAVASSGSARAPVVPAPAPADAAPVPAHATASPGAPAREGVRMSWEGVVTLAAVLLGGLAVLLGALPLMSTSAASFDALSRRQARTLAGWLAAGMDTRSTPVLDPRVLESVLAQPGVERAAVLDKASGRAIAPAAVTGRTFEALPGIGEGWREVTSPQVGLNDAFADAYVPDASGAFVAWVRYRGPTASQSGLAVIVALLIAFLIKRHTRATLQQFTRQVELAVSGANPSVMQGGLMPGLDRLPGVVTYLLEQRKAAMLPQELLAGSRSGGVPVLEAGAAPIVVDAGPPWLDVTPSLVVSAASAHGPDGAAGWGAAKGRHLLDVLESNTLRHAVVQGLGALGMQAGAEVEVPAAGEDTVGLRRNAAGDVRVTLGKR